MASVKGFELKGIKGFRGDNGEPMQQANLYFENKKVGLLTDDPEGGTPIIMVADEVKEQWEEAVAYFKTHLYDEKDVATEEELFYFLLTLKEWERIYKQQEKLGATKLIIFEEMDGTHGFRTGGYRVYACQEEDNCEEIEEESLPVGSNEHPTQWRKLVFAGLDSLDLNETEEKLEIVKGNKDESLTPQEQ